MITQRRLRITTFLLASLLLVLFGVAMAAQAAHAVDTGLEFGSATGLSTRDVREVVSLVIRAALGLLGLVVLVCIIYGGFLWMTASGNEEQVEKAKATIRNCMIGLVVIMVSYALTLFIFDVLGAATGDTITYTREDDRYPRDGGANKIIERYYPTGRETGDDIPGKDVAILITFRKALDATTVVADLDENNAPYEDFTEAGEGSSVKIVRSSTLNNAALAQYLEAVVTASSDGKTYRIRPTQLFPTPTDPTNFTVILSCDITFANGDAAFAPEDCKNDEGFRWSFNIANKLDAVPPFVKEALPAQDETDVFRNKVVQMSFSEPVDPIQVNGGTVRVTASYADANGAAVVDEEVKGALSLSSGYRTLEFIPEAACDGVERNSCGVIARCLPGLADITITVHTSALADPAITGKPFAARVTPKLDDDGSVKKAYPDGTVDLANNALYGSASGATFLKADIPNVVPQAGLEDQVITFTTNNEVDLVPPIMEYMTPKTTAIIDGTAQIKEYDIRIPVVAQFSKPMRASTMVKDYVNLQAYSLLTGGEWITTLVDGKETNPFDVFYMLDTLNVGRSLRAVEQSMNVGDDLEAFAVGLGAEVTRPQSFSSVAHNQFFGKTIYRVEYLSGVQDGYQNCFNPAKCIGASCEADVAGSCAGTGASQECDL